MTLAIELEKTFGKLTDEQFFAFCQANKGRLRIERDENGQILLRSLSGALTSMRNAGLSAEFVLWNRQNQSGKVLAHAGFTLPDTSVRGADVSWLSDEKWNHIPEAERKRFARVVPDFVLELRSASDQLPDLQHKMDKWIANGVRLAWLIDVGNAVTYIYRPGQPTSEKPFTETLSGEEVLPGFSIHLKQFFESLA